MAAKRADALLEAGDAGGQSVWNGVPRAVEELVRAKPKMGESVNYQVDKSVNQSPCANRG